MQEAIDEAVKGLRKKPEVTIGTMIETPRAALRADEIAEEADFFSFGTNDLTQMTFGFSRDDVESRMMPAYLEQGLLKRNPFETIDQNGVGELVQHRRRSAAAGQARSSSSACAASTAATRSRSTCSTRPASTTSAARPFRVPIARLAAAQAIVGADQRHEVTCAARGAETRLANFVDLDVQPWHWVVLLGVHRRAAAGRPPRPPPRGPRGRSRKRRRSSRPSGSRSASAFGRRVWAGSAARPAGEYISGYLIEKSLSVDNVFVWALILAYFVVPRRSTSTGCCSGASSARSCCGRCSSSPASR